MKTAEEISSDYFAGQQTRDRLAGIIRLAVQEAVEEAAERLHAWNYDEDEQRELLREWWEGKTQCPHKETITRLAKDCFVCLGDIVERLILEARLEKGGE